MLSPEKINIGRHLKNSSRKGFSLTELIIAMTIMVILITMSTPIYSRAIEQARLDAAARNLLTIWAAQRVYWLDNHTYALDLATLGEMDLIGGNLLAENEKPNAFYFYYIDDADDSSFTISAKRNGSNKWNGEIFIDQFGEFKGTISDSQGTLLEPITNN